MGCKSLSFRWALVLMRLSGAVGNRTYRGLTFRWALVLTQLIRCGWNGISIAPSKTNENGIGVKLAGSGEPLGW